MQRELLRADREAAAVGRVPLQLRAYQAPNDPRQVRPHPVEDRQQHLPRSVLEGGGHPKDQGPALTLARVSVPGGRGGDNGTWSTTTLLQSVLEGGIRGRRAHLHPASAGLSLENGESREKAHLDPASTSPRLLGPDWDQGAEPGSASLSRRGDMHRITESFRAGHQH